MKNSLVILFVMALTISQFITSCSSTPKTDELADFVSDAFVLQADQVNENEPIVSILAIAKKQASQVINFKEANAVASLAEAQKHKHAFIVVGKHTIVRITDFADCQKSTSWAASMPYGKALVQNDGLNSKSDYINQIIGLPDNQARWMLLFD